MPAASVRAAEIFAGLQVDLTPSSPVHQGRRPSRTLDGAAALVVVSAIVALRLNIITVQWQLWEVVTVALTTAVAAYRLRETRRSSYGVVEFGVGLALAIVAFVPRPPLDLRSASAFLGAVYLMVRALDNIRTGISSRHQAGWDRVFKA